MRNYLKLNTNIAIIATVLCLSGWTLVIQAEDAPLACRAILVQVAVRMSVETFLNCPPPGCIPLLHQAVTRGDWSTVEELLGWGANPNVTDSHGHTAYQVAYKNGDGAKFRHLVVATQGDGDLLFQSVRLSLKNLGFTFEQATSVILKSPDQWDQEVTFSGKSNEPILQRAIKAGEVELIRFLVDVKGLSLAKYYRERVREGQSIQSDSENYILWSIALNSHDNDVFFNFLKEQDFPVLKTYQLAWGMGPLSLFFGFKAGVIPKKFSKGQPVLDIEKIRFFLHKGIEPGVDRFFVDELLSKPVEHAEVWKILNTEAYPAKVKTASDFALAFIENFDLKTADPEKIRLLDELFSQLGVDFKKLELDVGSNSMFGRSDNREKIRYLVQRGVNPRKTTSVIDMFIRNFIDRRLSRSNWDQESQFALYQLIRKLKFQRLANITPDLLDIIQGGPANRQTYVINIFELLDYLIHDSSKEFLRPN